MSDAEKQAGLGDYLEWASSEDVMFELLDRGNTGICVIFKDGPEKDDPQEMMLRYKVPKETLDKYGERGSVMLMLKEIEKLVRKKDH